MVTEETTSEVVLRKKSTDKPRILIVDDELENLENLKMTFRREYNFITASNGFEGLEKLKEDPEIKVIIADFNMPTMKGDEFLEKAQEISPKTVRMILSGHAHNKLEDMISTVNKGNIFRYIAKPFQNEDVHSAILSALKYYDVSLQLTKTQEELVESQKLALIGSFAGGIVHEVKNQLSGLMIAQVMREKFKEDLDIQRYATMILRAKDRIFGIVEEIRDYVRNEKTRYEVHDIGLIGFMEETLSIVRFDTDLRGVDLQKEYEEDSTVKINQDKIGQVVINLIRNGAQAMENTAAENKIITVKVKKSPTRGIIQIADHGSGIPKEIIEKIWEPFFSTKGKKGTGLGLELCKRIIEQGHSGSLTVESVVGEGSIFTMEIPLSNE